MKYIAKQVPLEEQWTPIDFYPDFAYYMRCEFPGVIVTGNDDLEKYETNVFKRVLDTLEYVELSDIIQHWKDWKGYYKNVTDAIMSHLCPEHKKKYNTHEIHRLKELIVEYQSCSCGDEDDIICNVLEIVTGKPYAYMQISGCVQGEWQEVYFPCAKYNYEDLKRLEADYFGYVDQWEVYDENKEYFYNNFFIYSDNREQVKKEIAEQIPCAVDEIELQVITGYSYQKIVNYETA